MFARSGTITRRRPIRRALLVLEELDARVVPTLLGQQLFPSDYPWNQNISNAPVASNSAAIISHIGSSIKIHPDWGEDSASNGSSPLYGIPYNVVHGNSSSVTKINVIIDNYPGESDIIPVPIPTGAVIEGDYQNGPNPYGGGYNGPGSPGYGTSNPPAQRGDSHLIVWDEDNNIAYELYGVTRPSDPDLFPNTSGVEVPHTDGLWHAAQESVWQMTTDGFRPLGDTSADAAGLSILAGLVRPDEGLSTTQGGQGAIDHALRFTLPSGDVNPQYIYPASHVVNDSSGSTKLPFGARLRLMNTPAVNTIINGLGPEAQVIARAMQQYGLVLADIGSAMFVTGTSASEDANNAIDLTWNMSDVLGLSALTASDFQVVNLTPVVTGLSVSSAAPGSLITVIGQNFSGAAGHLSVLFGGTQVNSVTFVDDAHLTVVVPPGSGTVGIQVQSGVNETDPNNPNDNVNNPIFGYGTSSSTTAPQFTFQAVSAANSTDRFATGSVDSGNPDPLTIVVKDTTGNIVTGLTNSAFSFVLSGGTSAGTFGTVAETRAHGTYTTAFTGTSVGTASTLSVTVSGVALSTRPSITVTTPLTVTSFIQTSSGFTASFSEPFVNSPSDPINLYDAVSAGYGPADVTLVGQTTGAVTGSLIINAANTGFTFLKTGGVLAPDTYTATIVSGVAAFQDTNGGLLNGNGASPSNYVATFTVAASTAVVVSVPSFARGPDSTDVINLPNTSTNGVPISLSNGSGVTTGKFTLQYNANLLNITGAFPNPSLSGATFALDSASTPGNAILDFSSPTALAAGAVQLGGLRATVPANAPYKSKELLHFSSVSLNGGAIAAVGDDGVHVVAFLGDTTGDGTYTSADSVLISQVAVGSDSGFAAYPVIDPLLIGNISGSGHIRANDATVLNFYLTGTSETLIPPYPGAPSNNPSGPDPTLHIPTDLQAAPDGTLSVPVLIDDPHPPASSGLTQALLALTFNPALVSVSATDIHLGTVPASGTGWVLQSRIDPTTGQLGIILFSTTPIATSDGGSLVIIDFHLQPGAAGTRSIQLVAAVDPNGRGDIRTALDDLQGPLTLHPAPTPAASDPVRTPQLRDLSITEGTSRLDSSSPDPHIGSEADEAAGAVSANELPDIVPDASPISGAIVEVGDSDREGQSPVVAFAPLFDDGRRRVAPGIVAPDGILLGAGLDSAAEARLLDALSLSALDCVFVDAAALSGDALAG